MSFKGAVQSVVRGGQVFQGVQERLEIGRRQRDGFLGFNHGLRRGERLGQNDGAKPAGCKKT